MNVWYDLCTNWGAHGRFLFNGSELELRQKYLSRCLAEGYKNIGLKDIRVKRAKPQPPIPREFRNTKTK